MVTTSARPDRLGWKELPSAAQLYVIAVVVAGACTIVVLWPRERPPADTFVTLVAISCLLSVWKVNLPLPLSSGSTLSVSYAADLAALLLVGPRAALLVALAGAYAQCTISVKRPYPLYRTAFSLGAEAITMAATSVTYAALGGEIAPADFASLPKPLVGAIATYFIVNTGLVASAIGLSSRRNIVQIWIDDFLWSGASFMMAGSAGACAAVLTTRGQIWTPFLLAMPVYVVYRTYSIVVARLDEQRRHVEETTRLHDEAVRALRQARESEQALAQEKARLMVVLSSIGDGVIATDLDGTILLMNAAAETMTGWPRDDAIGRPLALVFQDADLETRKRSDTGTRLVTESSGPPASRRSAVLIARDLSERPIEECAKPLRDGTGQTIGLVLAFRDISAALRAQEERARADRLASLGLLAGGIAHDFNNVLMAIMGNISMVRATTTTVAGSVNADALASAEQACVRARQITWQLQTFARGAVPHKKPIALARVLEESASLALRGSNVACSFDMAADLWTIEADDCQLVQVFMNVLINAQQAMPHGGVITMRAENVFELTERSQHALRLEPGPYVRVSVVDAGIGIPREHLSRIFDPYFGTKQRGSGLGLATAHSIVKNHGGFVSVESEPGRGTTMTIHFPAVRAEARRAAPPVIVSSGHDRPCVLVMDDEASARALAANMLDFLGYSAEVVETGSAAIARFEHALGAGHPFDAVMLDLVVPGDLGAREAMDRLTTLYPAARGILVTGYAQDAAVTAYRDHGFAAAITKPYTLQELEATLKTVITSSSKWRVH